jgi:hypothetical protein
MSTLSKRLYVKRGAATYSLLTLKEQCALKGGFCFFKPSRCETVTVIRLSAR